MRKITFLMALIGLMFSSFGQITFEKTYSANEYPHDTPDHGQSIVQTSDGGYVVVGSTGESFNEDVYLIKTDANGDTIWTKIYGDGVNMRNIGYSIVQTSDGGYLTVGEKTDGVYHAVYLIKTDANGDTTWTKTYNNGDYSWWCYGYSLVQTSDDGYVIAGGIENWDEVYSEKKSELYLIKTDANGDTIWTKTYGGPEADVGRSVVQTSDGGYVVVGSTGESFSEDVYLIKTDANGDTTWTKTYGDYASQIGYSVVQTSDGGYVIVGNTRSYGAGGTDVYLIKTDANGDSTWTKTYGGPEDDEGQSVVQTSDGGYVITGRTSSYGAGGDDVYLIKTDTNGDSVWTKTYGGPEDDEGQSVQKTSDGGYVIAGGTETLDEIYYEKNSEIYLIKTDANGNVIICDKTLSEINLIGCDFVTTPSGISVYQTGEIEDVITNSKGCDSIITINVLINESKNVNDTILYFVSDTNFTSSQELVFKTDSTKHLSTYSTGCDSLVYIYNMFTYKPDTMVIELLDTTEVLDTMTVMDTTEVMVYDTQVVTINDTNEVMIDVYDTTYVSVEDTLVITMSSDTAVGVDLLTTQVNVYPNPASTQLNVEIDMSGDYTVSLTNINGQMVFTQANVVDDLQIDISDFTQGLYFITITDNDGVLKAEERKIVIE